MKKPTQLEDALFQTLCNKHGKTVKSGNSFKFEPLTFKEMKEKAVSDGMEVSKETKKGDIIAFYYGD
jgi:hypothetical protein